MEEEKSIVSFETLREIGMYEISNLTQKEPSFFNGWIRIKKYKVTIEEVVEPKEVYEQRIQELWDKCDNPRYHQSIIAVAESIGYELKQDFRKKK